MPAFSLFDSKLAIIYTSVSTVIILYVFIKMSFSYTKKRAHRHYATDRISAPSILSFKIISKFLFVSSMLLTLMSYWLTSPFFFEIYKNPGITFSGAVLVLIGYINLNRAFNNLGQHYSPSFDAYLPSEIVTVGSYRFIRHPIYLFNLFVSFGLAISSGSALVLANALIGLAFILRTISIEESYLKQHFSAYELYSKKTWRLIPYLY